MKKYLAFDSGGSSIKWAILNLQMQICKKGPISRQNYFNAMIIKMIAIYHNNQVTPGITISAPESVNK